MFDTRPHQPLGDPQEHYWLVQRMAQANGTDLVLATDAGILRLHTVENRSRVRPCAAAIAGINDADAAG